MIQLSKTSTFCMREVSLGCGLVMSWEMSRIGSKRMRDGKVGMFSVFKNLEENKIFCDESSIELNMYPVVEE